MHDLSLSGSLSPFMQNFLFLRNFRVRVRSTLLDLQNQEEGNPQGSILSFILFSIKINDITKCLNPTINCTLYVDIFVICYKSTHIRNKKIAIEPQQYN